MSKKKTAEKGSEPANVTRARLDGSVRTFMGEHGIPTTEPQALMAALKEKLERLSALEQIFNALKDAAGIINPTLDSVTGYITWAKAVQQGSLAKDKRIEVLTGELEDSLGVNSDLRQFAAQKHARAQKLIKRNAIRAARIAELERQISVYLAGGPESEQQRVALNTRAPAKDGLDRPELPILIDALELGEQPSRKPKPIPPEIAKARSKLLWRPVSALNREDLAKCGVRIVP